MIERKRTNNWHFIWTKNAEPNRINEELKMTKENQMKKN